MSKDTLVIDAAGMYYRQLNEKIRAAAANGVSSIELLNVNGQRYIADGLKGNLKLVIKGTPGNNLASFMNGPEVHVMSNAQEQVANTMNEGKVVIHGNSSDVVGYGMRGGKVFVRGNVGYRVGIHMKEYKNKIPVIVVGNCAGDFLGEYMAGGRLVVLGLDCGEGDEIVGDFVGTGMHGGALFIRGKAVPEDRLGREPQLVEITDEDKKFLESALKEYCEDFALDFGEVMSQQFYKYVALSHRPYGNLYANQP